jgi:hypothetical protein
VIGAEMKPFVPSLQLCMEKDVHTVYNFYTALSEEHKRNGCCMESIVSFRFDAEN